MYSPHHTPNTSPKKPSPLSYATSSNPSSPRASPFKRAQSPTIQQNPAHPLSAPTTPRARARTPSQTVRAGTSAAPAPESLLSPSRSPTRDVFAGRSEYPVSSPAPAPLNVGSSGNGDGKSPRTRERSPDVREVFGAEATVAGVVKGEGASPAVPLRDVGHWSPGGTAVAGARPSSGARRASRGDAGPGNGASPAGAVGAVRTGSPARAPTHSPVLNDGRHSPTVKHAPTTSNPRDGGPLQQMAPSAKDSLKAAMQPQQVKTPTSSTRQTLSAAKNDPMSKVHPARLREMHESFQVLDRDSDGLVDRSDVAEMLAQLGQSNDPTALNAFLPTSQPPTHTNLPNYLSNLTSLLAPLSPTPELSAAFSAFDTDDSGQIDVGELRAALVQGYDGARGLDGDDVDAVLGEFGGRRMFAGRKGVGGMMGAKGAGGEVFRWREFVGAVSGSEGRGGEAAGGGQKAEEDVGGMSRDDGIAA